MLEHLLDISCCIGFTIGVLFCSVAIYFADYFGFPRIDKKDKP